MSTQHAHFQARLEGSRPAVEAVAAWLRAKGYELTVPKMTIASSADTAWLHIDHGDIILADGRVIEVKGLHYVFPPWPERFGDRAFLGTAAQVERNPIFIFVNPELTVCGIVLPSTRDQWFRVTFRNKNTGNIEERYACPLDCVIWKRVTR